MLFLIVYEGDPSDPDNATSIMATTDPDVIAEVGRAIQRRIRAATEPDPPVRRVK